MIHVGFFVLFVQLPKCHQFLGLFDKSLNYRNAGKALLRKIGKLGKCLLPDVPLFHHLLSYHRCRRQQKCHGYQGQQRQQRIHLPHIHHRQHAQQQSVEKHHNAPAKTLLHGVQIVGKQTHQISNLVDLIVFPAQILGMVKHPVTQVCRQTHPGTEKAYSPQETSENHCQNDSHHGHTDAVQQKIHVKCHLNPIHADTAAVHAIDYQTVQLGDFQLQIVHCDQ